MTMTTPGFTAELAVRERPADHRTLSLARVAAEVIPARSAGHGVECHTGHCGCYADEWWGLPCLCCEYW